MWRQKNFKIIKTEDDETRNMCVPSNCFEDKKRGLCLIVGGFQISAVRIVRTDLAGKIPSVIYQIYIKDLCGLML